MTVPKLTLAAKVTDIDGSVSRFQTTLVMLDTNLNSPSRVDVAFAMGQVLRAISGSICSGDVNSTSEFTDVMAEAAQLEWME